MRSRGFNIRLWLTVTTVLLLLTAIAAVYVPYHREQEAVRALEADGFLVHRTVLEVDMRAWSIERNLGIGPTEDEFYVAIEQSSLPWLSGLFNDDTFPWLRRVTHISFIRVEPRKPPIDRLLNFRSLKVLWIHGDQIGEDDIEFLEEICPGLTIEFFSRKRRVLAN